MDTIKKSIWKTKSFLKSIKWKSKSYLRKLYHQIKTITSLSPQARLKIKTANAKKKSILSGKYSINTVKSQNLMDAITQDNNYTSPALIGMSKKIYVPADMPVKIFENNNSMFVVSELNTGEFLNVYLHETYKLNDYPNVYDKYLGLIGKINLDLSIIIKTFDNNKNPLDTHIFPIKKVYNFPKNVKYVQLGLRIKGAGVAELQKLAIVDNKHVNDFVFNYINNKTTIVSNLYPSNENIYRNMFVHSRLMEYKNKNYNPDVLVVNNFSGVEYRQFSGINVLEIDEQLLTHALNKVDKATLCIHFLTENMWAGIKDNLNKLRVIVWLHGSEIQPWWRREYNCETPEALAKEKEASNKRAVFWNEVFSHPNNKDIHYVFVSEYFKNEVCEDYKLNLPPSQYTIIHNYINTTMFNYVKKPVEQRKKILTIKPFANNKYANDVTQKAILELSKNPIFKELEIAIYGDGQHFERDTKGLEKFPNVKLNKGFLLQDDIAALHKNYGVYIATTRMDAQGVSRDEAMSSGLVPIANAVAAIPEFVDDNCGMLVAGEDYMGVADAVIRLYNEPKLFEKLSQGAAERVRNQSGFEQTINKEIELIKNI